MLNQEQLKRIKEEVITEGGLFANMLSHYILDTYGEEQLDNYKPENGFVNINLSGDFVTYTIVYNNKKVIDFVFNKNSKELIFDENAFDYAFDYIEEDIESFTSDILNILGNTNWVSFNINLYLVC